jgi:hypothetical protein
MAFGMLFAFKPVYPYGGFAPPFFSTLFRKTVDHLPTGFPGMTAALPNPTNQVFHSHMTRAASSDYMGVLPP